MAPRQAMWYINGKKDEGLRPQHMRATVIRLRPPGYVSIRLIRKRANRRRVWFDFAELLLRAHELWLNKPHILNHYRERFTNIWWMSFRIPTTSNIAWIRCWPVNVPM